MKTISTLLLALACAHAAWAAPTYTVRAQAVDTVGEPEAFVTYRIFALPDTLKPVRGAVAGDDGLISDTVARAGDYRIVVSSMSSSSITRHFSLSESHPVADLGRLILRPAATSLQGITVTAAKPLVTREIDRFAYDVKADPEAPTSYVSDVLRKVPLISVDPDGTVRLNGETGFAIYRNGRKNNNFTNNAKDIFQALPASAIKKIEVITDPGAREDAEGTGMILNIVTDSEAIIKGVTGSAALWLSNNNYIPAPSVNLITQLGKVTIGINGSFSASNGYHHRSRTVAEGQYVESGVTTLEEGVVKGGKSYNGYGSVEASYAPTKYDLFSVELSAFGGRSHDARTENLMRYFDPDGELYRRYGSVLYTPHSQSASISGSFNYQRSTRLQGESVTLSYNIYATPSSSRTEQHYDDLFNAPMDYTGINSCSRRRYTEHTAQVDWRRPFGTHHTLEVGGKFIHRNNSAVTDREYVGLNSTYDDFSHYTYVGAAFADYRYTLGRNFTARAGIRYEYSRLSAKYRSGDVRDFGSDFNDFAPNVSIMYRPDDSNTLTLGYNRSISRPGISYLDPAVIEGPLLTKFGNPNLKSATSNALNLGYSLIRQKMTLNASARFSFSNDGLSFVKWVEGERVFSSYGNLSRQRHVSLNAGIQWRPTSKTSVQGNFSVSYNHYRYPDVDLTNDHWSGRFSIYASQRLPWKLTLSGNASWSSGWANIYYKSETSLRTIYYGFALQRSFLKEDRLSVSLMASRPFGPSPSVDRTYSINSDYLATSTGYNDNARVVSVRVSYRFGKLQANVQKTGSRIRNDDVVGQ
ncbi:MAG: TonB-dependent receptor [Muribaculaceae bacterium]|nr:TonB-dependent receptor [Muribaculaceae bacterium]